MITLNNMLSDQMKDEEFRKEYEAIQPEMDVIRANADARISQNLTQKEFTGICSQNKEFKRLQSEERSVEDKVYGNTGSCY